MRPVRRGASPIGGDFSDFHDAKPWLVERLGSYCSYCERRMPTSLAVEHIRPQKLHPELERKWDNFLLSCVNCNSTKLHKKVVAAEVFLPDRDNTFSAFTYLSNGEVASNAFAASESRAMADKLLSIIGLNTLLQHRDSGGRVKGRAEVWAIAEVAKTDFQANADNPGVANQIVENARANGFFSIWMAVFADYPAMTNRFIDAFPGTRESGCFDPETAAPVSPAPNPDGLPDGGKI